MSINRLIDKVDWKIIDALIANARSPISIIAKKALISKQACFYRVKRLEADGIITAYKTKIVSAKFGLSTYAVYIRLSNITIAQEEIFLSKIALLRNIRWLVKTIGRWDLMLALSSENATQFHLQLNEILAILGQHLLDYETAMITSTTDLWRIKVESLKELQESGMEKMNLDTIDQKILVLLEHNSKIPLIQISPLIDMTAEASAYRIKQLVKKGFIHSFTISVNREKLGLGAYQVQCELNPGVDEKAAIAKMRAIKETGYVAKTIGKWNFEVWLYCKDSVEFRDKFFAIRTVLGDALRDYQVSIAVKKYVSKTYNG